MRRRDFLAQAGTAALVWPLAARAQQPLRGPTGRPWLIAALVSSTKAQSDIDSLAPFLKGLTALGYVEGRDYTVAARYTDGDMARLPSLAAELVGLSPNLILASSDVGAVAAHQLTTTIPIVGYFGSGGGGSLDALVGSLAKPIGNVTGITTGSANLTAKHCDLALEIVPTAQRIGALANSLQADGGQSTRDGVTAAAKARNFAPVIVDWGQPDEIAPAFRALADQRVDVVIMGSGTGGDRSRVTQAAADVRLPTVYNEQGYVEVGGLISYGFSRVATFVRLASLAETLLKGARPADVPAQQSADYVMAINLKTAKSLGLTIAPTVIFRADEVIQ